MVDNAPDGKMTRLPLAPLLGELAAVRPTEGAPDFINCHSGKGKAMLKLPCHSETSFRTYTLGGSWESASPWGSSMFQCSVKRKRIAASRRSPQ